MNIEINDYEFNEEDIVKTIQINSFIFNVDLNDVFVFADEEELRRVFSEDEIRKLSEFVDTLEFAEMEDEECEDDARTYAFSYILSMAKSDYSLLKLQKIGEQYCIFSYNNDEIEHIEED